MDCRGSEKRRLIVEKYKVTPEAHIQLLEGQRKHSDAGQIIYNDYYIFEAVNKTDKTKEIIQCGMGAARDFLRLLNHKGLPVFNPLHQDKILENCHNQQTKNNGYTRKSQTNWNPISIQLYNAIMWIIVIIDAKPDTPIFKIKNEIYQCKNKEPLSNQIKAVNTIISKTLPNTTLTESINILKTKNNIRTDVCQFDLLINEVNSMTDKFGKPLNIQPLF